MKKFIIAFAAAATLSTAAFAGAYDGDSRPFDIRDIGKQTTTNALTTKIVVKQSMPDWDARNDSAGMR
jgi:hypothetical protein